MPRRRADGTVPSWSRLCKVAAPQDGYFSGSQALSAGFSPQLLRYYMQKALVERTHRNIFRLTSAPRAEHEDLLALWLWSRQQGVFSHQTALVLHGLADNLPERLTLTMPVSWRRRRWRQPDGAAIYYADVPQADICQVGPLVLTSPLRTMVDCVLCEVDPGIVEEALRHAVKRKLLTRARLQRAVRATQHRPLPHPSLLRQRAV